MITAETLTGNGLYLVLGEQSLSLDLSGGTGDLISAGDADVAIDDVGSLSGVTLGDGTDSLALAGSDVYLALGSGADAITALAGNHIILGENGPVIYASPGVL